MLPEHSTTPGCSPSASARAPGQLMAVGSPLLLGSRHTSTESRLALLQGEGGEEQEHRVFRSPRQTAGCSCFRESKEGQEHE